MKKEENVKKKDGRENNRKFQRRKNESVTKEGIFR